MSSARARSLLLRDVAVAVAATVVAEVELVLAADAVEGPLAGHVLINLLILPALVLRRIRPLAAALVGALSMALQPFVGTSPVATGFLVLLVVLASLGWYAPVRRGLVGLGAVIVGGLTFELVEGVVLADLVVNVVLLVATWLAGHGLRVSSDRRVAAELAADRAASVAVQEERARISRDLHDSLGHALTLITLQAGSARERTEDPVAVDALQTIETSGRQAVVDLHGFLELLEAAAPTAPGLAELPALVDGVRRSGLTVDLAVTAGPLPEGPSAAVYRVVQEGLTNALRHSDASHASVDVHREAASVVTVVTSSGHPTAPVTRGAGRGLVGLRERLAALGGSVESVATSEGWRLEARIPATET